MMKRIFIITILCVLIGVVTPVNAAVMQGGVVEQSEAKYNRVYDKSTQAPISGAKISMPQTGFVTYSDANGGFNVPNYIPQNTILSVEKLNYKPFSITITDGGFGKPLSIGVSKSSSFDITIDSNICHLGDNNYSMDSANAYQFKSQSHGRAYVKRFFMGNKAKARQNHVVFGSIIGVDTALARGMGQNQIINAYASAPVILFNGHKIAEIKINGDNQRIKIPSELIRVNQQNELRIIAGRNLKQTAYVDYDDFEFMHINIE